MSSDIFIIVPVYNEEQSLAEFYTCLLKVIDSGAETFEVIFINDGSEDQTESMLRQLRQRDPRVKLIHFSRNFGHQMAITADLSFSFPNSWGSLELEPRLYWLPLGGQFYGCGQKAR